MKRNPVGFRQERGFSLVELMVVVAIIGVLATIAIPRVNRFIAKSRQSEAQVNLSSLYTFNKNFWVEFQGYTADFNAMGFQPEGQIRYNVGFTQAAATGPANYNTLKGGALGPNLGAVGPQTAGGCPAGSATTLACCPAAAGSLCQQMTGANGAAPPALTTTAIPAGGATFQAQALAVLVNGSVGCPGGDDWRITQDKTLTNNCDGAVR